MHINDIEKKEIERYMKYYDYREKMSGKTFLITGCKGIVGTGIIKWILMENKIHNTNAKIIASTRKPEEIPEYLNDEDNIVFCKFGEEKEFCKTEKIDYIIHAASPTGNTFHKAYPVESLRCIVDETENMLEIALNNPDVSMIYLSSEEVYGLPQTEEPVSETYVGPVDSLNIRSCYPLGKKTAELLCYTYFVELDVDVKIIRPTVIHGLYQKYTEQRVVNEILRCVIEKKDLVMKSKGLTKKCLMYSLDAISAIFTVLFKGQKGEAYNASNPDTFITVKDLANSVFEMFAPDVKIVYEIEDNSVSQGYLPTRTLVQNIDKLKKLGWKPITDLKTIYEIDIERFSNNK